MGRFFLKVRHLVPTYLIISLLSILGLYFFRWFFTVKYQSIETYEEYWEIWISTVIPWIPLFIWLKPRFKILSFPKKNNERRNWIIVYAGFVIIISSIITQLYFTSSTGEIQFLNNIEEIDNKKETRYYEIGNYSIRNDHKSAFIDLHTGGRYNQDYNIDVYIVMPILDSNITYLYKPYNWYGLKFHKQISNRLSDDKKEIEHRSFYVKCFNSVDTLDFKNINHFERVPLSKSKDCYSKAVREWIDEEPDDDYAILISKNEPYGSGERSQLLLSIGSFIFGTFILLVFIAYPKLDLREYLTQKNGKIPKDKDVYYALDYFIPRGNHFSSSLIADMNILVMLCMLFSGVDIISPSGETLLEWGGNRQLETTGGEWWRLFTSVFIHGGIIHLSMNIFGLFLGAKFIEPVIGKYKFAILYLLTGIIASLTSVWWYREIVSVGASGAIFGLYGSILVLIGTKAFNQIGNRLTIFFIISSFVVINLLWGISDGIDNAAHIGGLVSGILGGFIIYQIDYGYLKKVVSRFKKS